MDWVVETYGPSVGREIAALPADMRKVLFDLFDRAAEAGPEGLPPESFKHLEEKLWELRITGRDGIARAIYMSLAGRALIILHAFFKRTQKTPPEALETARTRMKDVTRRR